MTLLGIFVLLLFLFSLVSRPVDRTPLTPPIVFTAAGLGVALLARRLPPGAADDGVFLTIAELGLVLLLFADASHIDLKLLRSIRALPVRLLSVGMPLTIGLGLAAALVLFASAWPDLRPVHLVYGLLSLTVVRMLPVALALAGSGLSAASVGFVGWFGPRGLASIVLGLVYLEHAFGAMHPTIHLAVMATVLLSILAHGLSARPAAARYGLHVASLPATAPERARERI